MSKQVEFNIQESLEKLKKSLEGIEPRVEAEINQAIKDTAYAAYASIVAKAQAELNSTRQDYLQGLKIEELGDNTFLINLDGDWANKLEEGFPAFTMNDKMLASNKTVSVGSRAGQPWVQHTKPTGPNKESHKFANVPFERKPFSKAAKTSDLASAIREMTAKGVNNVEQKITKIYTDPSGSPLEGRVATGKSEHPLLQNLVKYQKTYTNAQGKNTVQAIYVNYRTISENGKPWIHPGFAGAHFFDDAEKEIAKSIDAIVKALL